MAKSKSAYHTSSTGCSASAISVKSDTSFDEMASEEEALAFSLPPYSAAAFFLCLGSLLVGFEVIGAVHEDAIVTIHVMSVEVFSCIADMCYAEEFSYLGSSHVNMSQETL